MGKTEKNVKKRLKQTFLDLFEIWEISRVKVERKFSIFWGFALQYTTNQPAKVQFDGSSLTQKFRQYKNTMKMFEKISNGYPPQKMSEKVVFSKFFEKFEFNY